MRGVIEQDICAECVHLRPSQPLPQRDQPPFVWEIKCDCAEGWPYTGVFVSANARSECPKFERVMQPSKPWPFPKDGSGTPGKGENNA